MGSFCSTAELLWEIQPSLAVQHTQNKIHPDFSEKKTKHLLRKLDRDHQNYYHFFTGRKWGNASNYDLCLNSAAYGIDGSVDFILRMLDREGKTNLPR